MTLHSLIKRTERVVIDNSPAIMTALGVTGTLATAWLTGRATFRAALLIEDEKAARNIRSAGRPEEMTPRELVDLTWKLYIPALSTAAITCTAIVMANRVSTKRATAVATAYALSERAHDEYRTRVVEKLGKNKEKEIHTEMAQARVNRGDASHIIIADGEGKVLCHDAFSNQFFKSNVEEIRKAVNDVNFQLLSNDFATVSDFYDRIEDPNLESNTASEMMGWTTDRRMEVMEPFPTTLYKDKIPCLSVVFSNEPVPTPWTRRSG